MKTEEKKIPIVSYFDDRFYKVETLDGQSFYYPSVTTKLGIMEKPFLAKWRGDIGNREADMRLFEAQERGKRIHYGWEVMTQKGVILFNPFERPNFNPDDIKRYEEEFAGNVHVVKHQDEMYALWKLKQFLDAVKPKILRSEMMVYSHGYKEAGTIDTVMEIEEGQYFVNGRNPLVLPAGLYVADLKTGNSFDEMSTRMQTAAYSHMYGEREGASPIGTLGIHTGAKTKTGIPGLGVDYRDQQEMDEDFKGYRVASDLWLIKNRDAQPQLFDFPALLQM